MYCDDEHVCQFAPSKNPDKQAVLRNTNADNLSATVFIIILVFSDWELAFHF